MQHRVNTRLQPTATALHPPLPVVHMRTYAVFVDADAGLIVYVIVTVPADMRSEQCNHHHQYRACISIKYGSQPASMAPPRRGNSRVVSRPSSREG